MNTTKPCRFCKEEILKDATVCKHCGKKQTAGFFKRVGQGILILFVIGIITTMISPSSKTPSTDITSKVSERLKVGEDGYISTGGTNPVLVGVTKEYYDEMFKLITAKDNLGVSQMVLDGKVLMVDSGTAIKVIASEFPSTEVRITEGKYIAQSGWVPNEMVHRQK